MRVRATGFEPAQTPWGREACQGCVSSSFQSYRVCQFRHARVIFLYGSAHAMICAHWCHWFHAYKTLVHRVRALLSPGPFYFAIEEIILSASAIPGLFKAYLVPFLAPETLMRALWTPRVRPTRSALMPVCLAEFASVAAVTSDCPRISVWPYIRINSASASALSDFGLSVRDKGSLFLNTASRTVWVSRLLPWAVTTAPAAAVGRTAAADGGGRFAL